MSRSWQAGMTRRLALCTTALAIIGAGVGYAVGAVPPTWTSSSQILVTGAPSLQPNLDTALTRNQYVNQRMTTYAAVAVSDLTADTATRLQEATPGSLDGAVEASVVPNTTILALNVTGATPEAAQARASAVTNALQEVVERTENLPLQSPRVRLTVLSRASLPDPTTALPSAPTTASIGALAGAMLGLVAAAVFLVWLRWPGIRESISGRRTELRRKFAQDAVDRARQPVDPQSDRPTTEPRTPPAEVPTTQTAIRYQGLSVPAGKRSQ